MGMIQSSVNQIFSTAIKGVVGAMASEEIKAPKPEAKAPKPSGTQKKAMQKAGEVFNDRMAQSQRFSAFMRDLGRTF